MLSDEGDWPATQLACFEDRHGFCVTSDDSSLPTPWFVHNFFYNIRVTLHQMDANILSTTRICL